MNFNINIIIIIVIIIINNNSNKNRTSNVILTSFMKLLIVILITFGLSNWWQYDGSKYNDNVIESCSSTTIDACNTFCDHNSSLTLITVSDDFYGEHFTTGGYCTAELTQSCAYDYWLIFRLVPMLLHVLQLFLQFFCWFVYLDFVPQQYQYDLISSYWFESFTYISDRDSNIIDSIAMNVFVDVDGKLLIPSIYELLIELSHPAIYSVFAFIELVTSLYVWSELYYPPINCTSINPLSLYYYPILMTLFEMGKLNIYMFMRCLRRQEYIRGISLLFNVEVLFYNSIFTIILGILFIPNIIYQLIIPFHKPININNKINSNVLISSSTNNPLIKSIDNQNNKRILSKDIDENGIRLSNLTNV